jgi:hypothetical protein
MNLRFSIVLAALLVAAISWPAALPAQTCECYPYYLSEHGETLLQQGNIHNGLWFNRVYWQDQVWIAGVRYIRVLGMHAPASGAGFVEFRIPPGARFFQTTFGLARQDSAPNPNMFGDAEGRILIDAKPVWAQRVSSGTQLRTASVPVPSGAKILRLEVDSLGSNWSDHTTWADARFTTTP